MCEDARSIGLSAKKMTINKLSDRTKYSLVSTEYVIYSSTESMSNESVKQFVFLKVQAPYRRLFSQT